MLQYSLKRGKNTFFCLCIKGLPLSTAPADHTQMGKDTSTASTHACFLLHLNWAWSPPRSLRLL